MTFSTFKSSMKKTCLIGLSLFAFIGCGTNLKNPRPNAAPTPIPVINNVSTGNIVSGSIIAASTHYKATIQTSFHSNTDSKSNSYNNKAAQVDFTP